MKIESRVLEGAHFLLEPVTEAHRDELRAALDCDPDNWAIQLASAQGEHFGGYWHSLTETPGRIPFAVRDKASGRLAGTSSFLFVNPAHATLEVGGTWFRPEYRGGAVNPEVKRLMLGHAFDAGALRVELRVDARNARSRAAVLKLGATQEGITRSHFTTWTGHRRDSVIFSILAEEWPAVKAGLDARLEKFAAGTHGSSIPRHA